MSMCGLLALLGLFSLFEPFSEAFRSFYFFGVFPSIELTQRESEFGWLVGNSRSRTWLALGFKVQTEQTLLLELIVNLHPAADGDAC